MTDKFKLNKQSASKILMIVFSLLCSLLLWIYVTNTEGDTITQVYSGVKVVFDGESTMRESKGLVITSKEATSVRLSVSGSRRALSQMEAADISAVIDLSSITGPGNYTSAYKISFPSGTDASALTVNSRSPENITFRVDKLNSKMVEIQGTFSGSAAEGFSAEPLEFSPGSVRISGPENALDNVAYAWVEVTRQNVDKTLTFESDYTLMDADGKVINDESIELETGTVTVTLPIIAIKEIDLTLNIIPGGGATAENVVYTIEPSTITLSGDSDTLDGINSIQLTSIDLSAIDSTMSGTFPIVIPNDTEIVHGAKEAKVTVEIKGLSTKRVTVTNFSCTNVTPGYSAQILTESLNVMLRGPESVLEGISDVNVRAVADLAEYGTATGIVSAPVRIIVDGATEAGAFGESENKVYVNISVSN